MRCRTGVVAHLPQIVLGIFFEYVDWGSARQIGGLEWSTDEAPLKDAASVADLVRTIISKFWAFVEEPLRMKWGPASVSTPVQSET
jgi:hypothetical protein